MVITHLACVTDRIDRSISPRGGREERELFINLSKKLLERETAIAGDYCNPPPSLVGAMHG